MRATEIFFFARVIRAAMVGSETRNARAMSGTLIPHTSRRVSATCASWPSAGWRQMKISSRRSSGTISLSLTVAASASGSGPPDSGSGSTSSGNRARRAASCRIASIARRRAAVVSQAAGWSGTPAAGHVRRAAA
jgi:hypothetical protein